MVSRLEIHGRCREIPRLPVQCLNALVGDAEKILGKFKNTTPHHLPQFQHLGNLKEVLVAVAVAVAHSKEPMASRS